MRKVIRRSTCVQSLLIEPLEQRLCLAHTSSQLLADLNGELVSSHPTQFLAADDFVYFWASEEQRGTELWRTDGTDGGTQLIKDIHPATDSRDVQFPAGIQVPHQSALLPGNVLIFAADDGTHGRELWRSDGTPDGTFLLKDVFPKTRSSYPQGLNTVGDHVFFVATSPDRGRELWKTDGTRDGTLLVDDIFPGPADSTLGPTFAVNERMFFVARDDGSNWGIWTSDGTASGTVRVRDANGQGGVVYYCGHSVGCTFRPIHHPTLNRVFYPGPDGLWVTDGTSDGTFRVLAAGLFNFSILRPVGDKLFFGVRNDESSELWESDGARNGTKLVTKSNFRSVLAALGDSVYFTVNDQLWRTDGTGKDPELLNLNSGRPSYPLALGPSGEAFFFAATDSVHGRGLWRADESGISLVHDIGPDENDSPLWGVALGSQFVYATGHQLWAIDTSGTNLLLQDGEQFDRSDVVWQDRLFLTSRNGKIWTTDGTPLGTRTNDSIIARTQDSSPQTFVSLRGKNFTFAFDGSTWALQMHDPLSARIETIHRIPDGPVGKLQLWGDRLVFLADRQLWISDGTSEGTLAMPVSSVVTQVGLADDALFLSTDNDLYQSDGTASGTVIVKRNFNGENLAARPRFLTTIGEQLYFEATSSKGRELWTSDGSASGTVLVKDIHIGQGSSYPSELVPMGSSVIFAADDGNHGRELWISDGTEAGTLLVKDIYPEGSSSDPTELRSLGNSVIFAADDGKHGPELWISDGTATGTYLVADLETRESRSGSTPERFARVGATTYVVTEQADGQREVWSISSDRNVAPHLVAEGLWDVGKMVSLQESLVFTARDQRFGPLRLWIVHHGGGLFQPSVTPTQWLTVFGGSVYFRGVGANGESGLWKTDGTAIGTELLADIDPHFSATGERSASSDNTLFFVAYDRSTGHELWKSNGTSNSTTLVRDINRGGVSSHPADLRIFGESLLFVAEDGGGRELWITDGTEEGTRLVADLRGEISNNTLVEEYVEFGAWTYFAADDGVHGQALWRTDGTATGTRKVTMRNLNVHDRDIRELRVVGDYLFFTADSHSLLTRHLHAIDSSSTLLDVIDSSLQQNVSSPEDLVEFAGRLYFTAQVGCCNERRLYRVEPSPEPVNPIRAVEVSPLQNPTDLTVVGEHLFFVANDGQHGRELWKTDGTRDGTTLVRDIFSAMTVASAPGQFVKIDDIVYFTAVDSSHGIELWSSDGSLEGTNLILDILPGVTSSDPRELTAFHGKLAFTVRSQISAGLREVWLSDGTSEGTHRLQAQTTGQFAPSNAQSLVTVGEDLYFFANNTANIGAQQLWKSDGTDRGTVVVNSIPRTDASDDVDNPIVVIGETLFFAAEDATHGRELWKSDGSRSGTELVKDIRSGAPGAVGTSAAVHKLVRHESLLYFAADSDGRFGNELWVTDGTEAGTRLVDDPRAGSGPDLLPLAAVDEWLYYSSPRGDLGNELWRTDGTRENTMLVADLSSGPASSIFFPHGEFTKVDANRILFPAITAQGGAELWVTDGTRTGTYSLDLEPGPGSTQFGKLVQTRRLGNRVYFFAAVPSRGSGLWATDGTVGGTNLILPAPYTSNSFVPWPDLTLLDDTLYFGVTAPAGNLAQLDHDTIRHVSLQSGDNDASSFPDDLIAVADQLYFVADDGLHGRQLWVSNGTEESTSLLSDLENAIDDVLAVGPQLFFTTSTPEFGDELWTTAGTTTSTRLVRDIRPGPEDANPDLLVAWNSHVVFSADGPSGSSELWVSDGTELGTRRLFDPISNGLFGVPQHAVVVRNQLFVTAESPNGDMDLWRFDDLVHAPIQVASGLAEPPPSVVGDRLYFTAFHPQFGFETWISDGTAEGSSVLADINRTTPSSDPRSLVVLGGNAYFLANDDRGIKLWESDGTEAGTRTVHSFIPDLAQETPQELLASSTGLFLTQSTPTGTTLWKVDPTFAKAQRLWLDSDSQQLVELLSVSDDRLIFLAAHELYGTELWVSDGTAAGTHLVRDIRRGGPSSNIGDWVPYENGLVFRATDESNGRELWFTDGTDAGTYSIADIRPGPKGSEIGRISVVDDLIYFSATDGVHGVEPWVSDGTAQGTRMLANLESGTTIGSDPGSLTIAGANLFFAATTDQGRQLWRWSPSLAAPTLVSRTILDPTEITAANTSVIFSGYRADVGTEIWMSDGTEHLTRLLADAVTGRIGSSPQSISVTNDGIVYFSAVDGIHGREPWWLPALDGDTDGDRDVDFFDFLTLAANFGQQGSREEGDFDADGLVDFADFLRLGQNFGPE